MAIYYFHIRSGARVELDSDGIDCPDLAAAKRHGIALVSDRRAQTPDAGAAGWRVEIADQGGQYLASVDGDGVVAD